MRSLVAVLAVLVMLVNSDAAGAAQAGTHELVPRPITRRVLSGRVVVDAELVATDDPLGPYEARLRVRSGRDCFQAETFLIAPNTADEAFEELRGAAQWKDDYLFVRTECGPGNAWKCVREDVFVMRHGRLTPLGSLLGSLDTLGASFRDGTFHDLDADWESDFTGHAGAPSIELVLREADGRFAADLERTWRQNQRSFAWNDSAWRSDRDSVDSQKVDINRISPLLGNAVIATYCKQREAAATVMEVARRRLDPATLQHVQATLDAIEPGALPRTSRPTFRRCGSSGH